MESNRIAGMSAGRRDCHNPVDGPRAEGGIDMAQKTWGPFNGRHLTVIVVALILGAVALPGAVWAVDTFSNVAIQDPVTGVKAGVNRSQALLVGDAAGALTVDGKVSHAPPTQVVNSATYIGIGKSVMFGPTTATLALDRLALMNTSANWSYNNTSFYLMLYVVQGATATDCYNASNPGNRVTLQSDPGTNVEQQFPTPLVFKPQSSTAKYCVMLSMSSVSGTNPASYYLVWGRWTGYVVPGTSTGPGAGAAPPAVSDAGEPLAPIPSSASAANQPEYLPPLSA